MSTLLEPNLYLRAANETHKIGTDRGRFDLRRHIDSWAGKWPAAAVSLFSDSVEFVRNYVALGLR